MHSSPGGADLQNEKMFTVITVVKERYYLFYDMFCNWENTKMWSLADKKEKNENNMALIT